MNSIFKKQEHIFLAIIIAITFLTNINTVKNEYGFDDEFVVNVNKLSNPDYGIIDIFTEPYGSGSLAAIDYRPITKLSLYMEYLILKSSNPYVSHFIQLILYLLLVALVFSFLQKISSLPVAFAATLLFALHPLHTEVVASLKNREEVLAMLFAMLSFLQFIKYFDNQKMWFLVTGLGLFFLSLLTKISAFPLILLIPFYYFLFYNNASNKVNYKTVFVVFTLLFFTFVLKLFISFPIVKEIREIGFNENPLVEASGIFVRVKAVFYTVYYYAKLLIFPFPLRHYYGVNVLPILNPPFYTVFIGFSIVLTFIYSFFKLLTKEKFIAFQLVWITVLMAPFLNIFINTGIIAERAIFIASLGFTGIIAYLMHKYFSKKIFYVLLSVISLVYAGLSFNRNFDWKNHLSLFEADAPYLKNAIMPNAWYSSAARDAAILPENSLIRDSLLNLSIEKCKNVLRITSHFGCFLNIGNIYMYDYNDPSKALPYFQKAFEINSEDKRILYELGYVNMMLNKPDLAIEYFNKTIAVFPESVMSYYYLAQIYMNIGNYPKALQYNTKILDYKPDEDFYYLNMGAYFNLTNNLDSTLVYYNLAIEKGNRDENLIQLLITYYDDNDNKKKVEELNKLLITK